MRKTIWTTTLTTALLLAAGGCANHEKTYGVESQLSWFGQRRQVWAVAPAINLSGMKEVDPLLQGDLAYQSLQEIHGITAIPVNRVVEVFAALHLDHVQSEEQAQMVCDMLGCDGLIVPSVTAFDPYDPPKFGGSVQLFAKEGSLSGKRVLLDTHQLERDATAPSADGMPSASDSFYQAVGIYDAQNGSVRSAVGRFAAGRNDPKGPLGEREYYVNMDRYCAFAYHELFEQLLQSIDRQ